MYLVFSAGDMHNARLMGLLLRRAQVPATLFAGNSPDEEGQSALSRKWGQWWRERAADGHALAVQPWDLPLLRSDLPGRAPSWRVREQLGVRAGREFTWDAARYCKAIKDASEWLGFYSEATPLPLFHAPGGIASQRLVAAMRQCGYAHVPWPKQMLAGDGTSGEELRRRALEGEGPAPGSILLTHLGSWPGQGDEDVAVISHIISGLKRKGYCFKTLAEHPDYKEWIAARAAAAKPQE